MIAIVPMLSQAKAPDVAVGGEIFVLRGCPQCHARTTSKKGSSLRDLQRRFDGDPIRSFNGVYDAKAHAAILKPGGVTPDDVSQISLWLAFAPDAGSSPPTAASSGTPLPAAVAAAPAAAKAESRRKRADPEGKEALKEKQASAAKVEREAAATVAEEARAEEARKKAAAAQAKREAKEARAAAKAAATAEAKAAKQKAAEEAASKKAAVATTQTKREADAQAKREADAQAKREADAQAKREADAQAKREADAQAKREADAQAKREADAQAKREADARASKASAPATTEKKKLSYRDGSDLPPCPPPSGQPIAKVDEERAKAIMERIDCTGCHAYVQKKTGPPMKKIFEKYKGDWECVESRLRKNKTHNDEGVTGEIKEAEFKVVAEYLATRAR